MQLFCSISQISVIFKDFRFQDFDAVGIPLSNTEVEKRPRSRSLDFDALSADDLVEMRPLLPLHSTTSQKPTPPSFYTFQQQQVRLHRQLINHHLQHRRTLKKKRKKRDVTLTSHRLPGSIDAHFLSDLVDQLNYTSNCLVNLSS